MNPTTLNLKSLTPTTPKRIPKRLIPKTNNRIRRICIAVRSCITVYILAPVIDIDTDCGDAERNVVATTGTVVVNVGGEPVFYDEAGCAIVGELGFGEEEVGCVGRGHEEEG